MHQVGGKLGMADFEERSPYFYYVSTSTTSVLWSTTYGIVCEDWEDISLFSHEKQVLQKLTAFSKQVEIRRRVYRGAH